jgi:glycyl-tRNA synthetase
MVRRGRPCVIAPNPPPRFCARSEAAKWHAYWIDECLRFVVDECGLDPMRVRVRHHARGELAHYATATADLEFRFEFGWGELCGVADRGDADLRAHQVAGLFGAAQAVSVIEPSMGATRLLLAMLSSAMPEEAAERPVLRLAKPLAPFQLAVLPVVSNKPELVEAAERIHVAALDRWPDICASLDLAGSVGKRYARHDEIGTGYCLTVDSDSLQDGSVSLRSRETGARVRVPASMLEAPTFRRFCELVAELGCI